MHRAMNTCAVIVFPNITLSHRESAFAGTHRDGYGVQERGNGDKGIARPRLFIRYQIVKRCP